MTTPRKRKLSTIQAAHMLGVAVSSISKWIDDGKLPAGRTPGGHRRIEREDLLKFARQQNLSIVEEESPASALKVLIVDDEKPFAHWLAEEIQERFPQLPVLIAHDGYSAGELVAMEKPEIILLDLHMPGMDGYEVCRRIKSNPLFNHIHIIAVTGDMSADAQRRILELGAHLCLEKPLDPETVLAEISEVVRPAS